MEESLSSEHGVKLLADPGEELLDGRIVSNKGSRHLQTSRWDVTDGGLDVVGDPFYKVGGVLGLYLQHLLVNLKISISE